MSDLDFDGPLQALLTQVPSLVKSLADETARKILQLLRERWPDQAEYQRVTREGFRLSLAARWGQPLALLGMLVTSAREFGENLIGEIRDKLAGRENLVDVLTRLHVRACQVTEEIRVLLNAGFADGAMARWRTLHEIAVAAMFIQQHGEIVAERYVLHQIVESRDALRVLIGREEALGEELVDPNEMAGLDQRVAGLLRAGAKGKGLGRPVAPGSARSSRDGPGTA